MKNDGVITLPKSGQPGTQNTPAVQSGDLHLNIGVAGSHAMNSLKESANKLVKAMDQTVDPKNIVNLANALASTITTQTNLVKTLMQIEKEFKK